MIKSENARLNGWVFIDIENIDIGQYVLNAQAAVKEQLKLPSGYSINWSGQYEYMQRAEEKLRYVIPLTLGIIIILLFINFKQVMPVSILLATLPLSVVGSFWLMFLMDFNFSIAVAVGLIALAGVAIETGIIMMVYLDNAWKDLLNSTEKVTPAKVCEAVFNGASLRVRPVLMTAIATIIGLLPILYGEGTGSEIMSRLSAPMVGGMISTLALTLFVLPVVYLLWKQYRLPK